MRKWWKWRKVKRIETSQRCELSTSVDETTICDTHRTSSMRHHRMYINDEAFLGFCTVESKSVSRFHSSQFSDFCVNDEGNNDTKLQTTSEIGHRHRCRRRPVKRHWNEICLLLLDIKCVCRIDGKTATTIENYSHENGYARERDDDRIHWQCWIENRVYDKYTRVKTRMRARTHAKFYHHLFVGCLILADGSLCVSILVDGEHFLVAEFGVLNSSEKRNDDRREFLT